MLLEAIHMIYTIAQNIPSEILNSPVTIPTTVSLGTILLGLKWLQSKIDKSVNDVKREVMREIDDMKKDIEENRKNIETNKDKSDKIVEDIKESLNNWRLEVVNLVADIKVSIEKIKK